MSKAPHLLLDTHLWVWLLEGAAHLEQSPAFQAIESSMKHGNVKVSAISFWEIGMLEAKGRIRFQRSFMDWMRAATSIPGMTIEPLSIDILVESSRLPGNLHGDPADRMIVATARKIGAILVTQDQRLLDYEKSGYLQCLKA